MKFELARKIAAGKIFTSLGPAERKAIREPIEACERLMKAFEYLVSQLPEECTAGFVTHARSIIDGDLNEIEQTK